MQKFLPTKQKSEAKTPPNSRICCLFTEQKWKQPPIYASLRTTEGYFRLSLISNIFFTPHFLRSASCTFCRKRLSCSSEGYVAIFCFSAMYFISVFACTFCTLRGHCFCRISRFTARYRGENYSLSFRRAFLTFSLDCTSLSFVSIV